MSLAENPTHSVAALARPIPELTAEEFRLFQALILRESGIHLGSKNRAMLVSRLWRRLRALELNSFAAYYRRVRADSEEMVRMLDCVCTNETHFFREPAAFECLRQHVFPEWRAAADARERGRTVRVWSAACSTGEEPYSLAMTLLTEFPPEAGWNVEVLGTDLSTKVLAKASRSIWPAEKISAVPPHYQRQFLLRGFGPDKGKIKAGDEIRRVVRFQRVNLTQDPCLVTGPFDLIFCRNVLIYFQWETKLQVVNRLGKYLAPGGYLFLGHAESLHGVTDKLESLAPKVFQMPRALQRGAALCILQRHEDAQT
ncbi:MAG TPA: protein-glutamate O-methyltransferase CheR [Candidatus Angelobacter sp.]|nr:protein-glutamate O-methyltransferase CheR [Candidatus Angelobacter sp.]